MEEHQLREEYNNLLERIENAQIYDGRNKGVDVYECKLCGERFFTRYKDKGVTPFTIKCRHCDHSIATHIETMPETMANVIGAVVHNWVRPTFEQLKQLDDGVIEHVLEGGLVLEDDLASKDDHAKEIQREAQKLLEQLVDTDASFMFIGDDGNCFTLGGDPVKIEAQIVFAMIRYPVVKEIIKKCAFAYEHANKTLGTGIKNVTLEHLIEINSGN